MGKHHAGQRDGVHVGLRQRRVNVGVRLEESERNNIDSLRGLLLDAPDGSQIPLDQVAKIGIQEGVLNISREAGRPASASRTPVAPGRPTRSITSARR